MKYTEWLKNNWKDKNLFPPALEPQQALDFLQEYLLGKDWYVVNPLTQQQVNCEMVHDILYRCSKDYRKEYSKFLKEEGK